MGSIGKPLPRARTMGSSPSRGIVVWLRACCSAIQVEVIASGADTTEADGADTAKAGGVDAGIAETGGTDAGISETDASGAGAAKAGGADIPV